MKTRINLPMLLLLVSIFMSACSLGGSLEPAPTIKGKLHRGDTPIAKASITLYNPSVDKTDPAFKVAEAETDAKGQYSLGNVKPGSYTLAIMILERNFGDLPCKSSGAFALDENTWASNLAFRTDDGSGILSLEIKEVKVVEGKVTERDINLRNCQ